MRRVLDRLSGIWCLIDGLGTLLIVGGAIWLGITTGIWAAGIAVIVFEVISVLNSFYVAHRGLTGA